VLNLKDEHGKRKQKLISLEIDDIPGNKRKAEKALRDILAEYEKSQITIYRKDTPFCDYLLVWLEETKPRLELISYEAYKSYIDLHIHPFFLKLGVSLQELNYQHLQRYYVAKGRDLSPNSLKKHHAVINQTLRKALKNDLITNNPADKVTLPKVEKYTGSFLSIEQGNILLEVSSGTPMEPAVILGMMYGLRRSEIAGLKWSAIDLLNNTLTVCHTVTKFNKQIARDGTKNKSSNRVLSLNTCVKAYLQRLYESQQEDRYLHGDEYHETEYLCRWPNGQPLKCDYLSKAFKKILKKNGLPDIRLHDLRHSCASYMLKMGCSMKEVADWLGHADIKTSMNLYAHLDDEMKQSVAKRFSEILTLKA
jgi:integrase